MGSSSREGKLPHSGWHIKRGQVRNYDSASGQVTFAAWWREGSDHGMLQDLANTYLNAPSAAGNIIFRAKNSLDTISRLIGVSFDWKKSGDHSIGFIAQEVESVLPEIVSTDKEGY